MTIRNGSGDIAGGGGILVRNADLTVRSCVITGNRTLGAGGGIASSDLPGTARVILVRTAVTRNTAQAAGGGVYVGSDGMNPGGTLTATNCTFRGNHGTIGGGVEANQATLTGCTFADNSAFQYGGGLSAGTATLAGCTVTDNFAGIYGGGILALSEADLTNCSLTGNGLVPAAAAACSPRPPHSPGA